MDETAAPPAPPQSERWRDLRWLLLLLLLTAGLRGWQLTHTEVASRDSIGFIRCAYQLRHAPSWPEVVRSTEQHPGYPLLVLLVSLPTGALMPAPDTVAMQYSAQLASALMSVLLVIPLYGFGRDLFGRAVAGWTTALFECLPASSWVLADGLSEATFFFFTVTAWWLALRALRGSNPWLYAGCGLAGGLAYLTRPEGALLVVAAGLVLLTRVLRREYRQDWPRQLACGAALAVGALAVAGPFVAVVGKLTTKPTATRVLQGERPEAAAPVAAPRPLLAAVVAEWWLDHGGDKGTWVLQALGAELVKGFHYVLWLPALLGLLWFRDRFRREPGLWVPAVVSLAVVALMTRVAWQIGYVSDRHMLTGILFGTYFAVAALLALPRRWPALRPHGWVVTVALVVLLASGLPKALRTLHADRAGFRVAGLWLAEHAAPGDVVFDPYCWSNYYAGRVFREDAGTGPPNALPVRYVVIEKSRNEHKHLPLVNEALRYSEQGRLVYSAPAARRQERDATVSVYAVPLSARP